jgi:hypothetical protein
MQSFTESVVEEAALAWLESLGWTVKHSPEPRRRCGPSGKTTGR